MTDSDSAPLPNITRRLVDASVDISDHSPESPDFLHAVLCQLGLPRSRQQEREFIRSAGKTSMMLKAGKRFDGHKWRDMPLPYGTKPRLALIHVSSESVRTQSPLIDVSDGICPFLRRVGISIGGRAFKQFKDQMTYLAASHMTFAFVSMDGRLKQTEANPIEAFEAWANPVTEQSAFWPDTIELGRRFFETLCEHAVPLDPRAVHALQHSALALDVYTWLAHRLCRIRKPGGVKLSWRNLKEQFGQEYKCSKDFKKKFKAALFVVRAAYPDAKIDEVMGGLMLYASPPPIPKTQVLVSLPKK